MGQRQSNPHPSQGERDDDIEPEPNLSRSRSTLGRSRSTLASLRSSAASSISNCVRRIRHFFSPASRRRPNPSEDLDTRPMMEAEDDSHLEEALEAQTLEDKATDLVDITFEVVNEAEPKPPAGKNVESPIIAKSPKADQQPSSSDEHNAPKAAQQSSPEEHNSPRSAQQPSSDEHNAPEAAKKLDVPTKEEILDEIFSNEYLDFEILRDDATISWTRSNLVMVIQRGFPGSGKSFISRYLVKLYTAVNGEEPVVCSADLFFIDSEGNYNYNPSSIQQAHQLSQTTCLEAIESGNKMIIVDNTHVKRWEMDAYFKMAEKYADKVYRIVILEPHTPWCFDPYALAERNSHGVTADVLRKKIFSYDKVISPMYYAWFAGRDESRDLLKMSYDLLKMCFEGCSEFFEDFKSFSSMMNLGSAMTYYNRDMCMNGNRFLVHCTAKFCGFVKPQWNQKNSKGGGGKNKNKGGSDRGRNKGGSDANISDDVDPYCKNKKVTRSLGTCQKLKVIGFVMTKETFGARVALSSQQLELYDQNEKSSDPRQYGKPQNSTLSQSNDSDSFSTDSSSFIAEDVEPQDESSTFYPIPGHGKRAHITLGTSYGVRPVNTGIDVMAAVSHEKEAAEGRSTPATYQLPGSSSKLRCYGNGIWVLYPDKCFSFDSLFGGHY